MAEQAETILVSATNNGDNITTSPVLKKADGSVVQFLEDLPEGIANTAWMKTTTSRLPLKVVMANGTYFLRNTWVWTPAHSGRADSPITIEAQTPGGVVIAGARIVAVSRSQHQGASKVVADFSKAGLTSGFEQLWVNGGRAVRARAPNLGNFYYVKKQVPTWAGSTNYDGLPVTMQAFNADPASLAHFSGLSTAEKSAAVLVALHSWTVSHHRVQEWNASNDVRVKPAAKWPFLYEKFGFAQRYFVENVPSALDVAGEWYLDPAAMKLNYLPTDAQKQGDLVFIAPRVKQLLHLKGQGSAGRWVEHVNFNGLKFRYAHAPLPAEGYEDGQAALRVDAAIQFNGSRHVGIKDCEISRVGGYGIWLSYNVNNVTIQGCEMYDMGAGGIKVGLPTQLSSDPNPTGYNTIKGNRIHAIGFQYPGAVGIWVGQSAHNNVVENLVGDTTYTGISVGWTWGYGPSPAHHNLIARNFLYNLVQGALSDGGGIYTLGVSTGTVIKGNVIKNVHAFTQYGAGAWGLYNDEGSTSIVMDSNMVVGTDNGGYLMHYGRDITLSNNVLALGDHAELQVTKAEDTNQVTFDQNYIVPTAQKFVSFGTPVPITQFRNNVVSTQYVPGITAPSECGSGCNVTGGVMINAGAEPLDMPVLTVGGNKVTLPQQVAPAWAKASLTPTMSPKSWWAVAPANIPARNFEFDAATAAFGSAPTGMRVIPANRPELVSVIRNTSGEKCLGFQDGVNVTNRWEPYSYVETNFDTGNTAVNFTLKVDAATEFLHEWRDYRNPPYKTGPKVLFSATRGVMIGARRVAALPVGEWVDVTISARQGAGQTWTMTLKYADGTSTTLTNLAPYTDGWASTKVVYFISDSAVASTTCVGKISIVNQ